MPFSWSCCKRRRARARARVSSQNQERRVGNGDVTRFCQCKMVRPAGAARALPPIRPDFGRQQDAFPERAPGNHASKAPPKADEMWAALETGTLINWVLTSLASGPSLRLLLVLLGCNCPSAGEDSLTSAAPDAAAESFGEVSREATLAPAPPDDLLLLVFSTSEPASAEAGGVFCSFELLLLILCMGLADTNAPQPRGLSSSVRSENQSASCNPKFNLAFHRTHCDYPKGFCEIEKLPFAV